MISIRQNIWIGDGRDPGMAEKLKGIIRQALMAFHLEVTRTNTPPAVYFQIDREFRDLYATALEKTQLSASDNTLRRQRNYSLMQLLKASPAIANEGEVAECGCWRGSSAYQIAYRLKTAGFRNKFFIFDSFEGLSDFQKEDLANNAIADPAARKKEFACPLDIVMDNLKEFDFIEYKKGWIPARFNETAGLKFSFIHIDVDLYQPIRDSLEFFYPRMVKGGIIVFDDYGYLSFPGAKKAVDEFLKGKSDFFLPMPYGGAFIIKK